MKRILIACLVLASCAVSAQESALLRLNYTQGDKYLLAVEMEQGMGVQGSMNMTMKMEMSVAEVSKESIRTESKITAIKMDMMQGGMSMKYDSESDGDSSDPIGQTMKAQFEPMMKATIHQTLDRQGNSIEMRTEPSIPGLDQISGNTNSISFPEEKVSVGSTWTSETEDQGLKTVTRYTVSSIANGIVVLDVSGEISGAGTGTINGKTNIDIKSGMQTSSVVEMIIAAEGMNMSINTSTTLTKV